MKKEKKIEVYYAPNGKLKRKAKWFYSPLILFFFIPLSLEAFLNSFIIDGFKISEEEFYKIKLKELKENK